MRPTQESGRGTLKRAPRSEGSCVLHLETLADVGFLELVKRVEKLDLESPRTGGARGRDLPGDPHDGHGVSGGQQRRGVDGCEGPGEGGGGAAEAGDARHKRMAVRDPNDGAR